MGMTLFSSTVGLTPRQTHSLQMDLVRQSIKMDTGIPLAAFLYKILSAMTVS